MELFRIANMMALAMVISQVMVAGASKPFLNTRSIKIFVPENGTFPNVHEWKDNKRTHKGTLLALKWNNDKGYYESNNDLKIELTQNPNTGKGFLLQKVELIKRTGYLHLMFSEKADKEFGCKIELCSWKANKNCPWYLNDDPRHRQCTLSVWSGNKNTPIKSQFSKLKIWAQNAFSWGKKKTGDAINRIDRLEARMKKTGDHLKASMTKAGNHLKASMKKPFNAIREQRQKKLREDQKTKNIRRKQKLMAYFDAANHATIIKSIPHTTLKKGDIVMEPRFIQDNHILTVADAKGVPQSILAGQWQKYLKFNLPDRSDVERIWQDTLKPALRNIKDKLLPGPPTTSAASRRFRRRRRRRLLTRMSCH